MSWASLAWWLDRGGDREPPDGDYDAIVVLGCRVRPDGSASPSLARRTAWAVDLYQRGTALRIIFTGGVGDHGESEASVAAELARLRGVPDDAIVLEDRSHSTFENARYTAELIGRDQRLLVVTDSYHVFRAQRVFQRHFRAVSTVGATGPFTTRLRGSVREVIAVVGYGLAGRL